MTLKRLLISLGRRWYVTLAGVLITAGLCGAAYANTSPTLERSASDLLVPGKTTIPEGGNPYLYLGGLGQVADVLVSSLKSEEVLSPIADEFPGTTLAVGRDTSTSGPMITMTVSGKSDAAVAGALSALADQVPKALAELQNTAGVPDQARISVLTLTKDTTSAVIQKGRIEVVGMIGAAGLVLTVLLVGLVDGLVRGRRQRVAQPPEDGPQTDAAREPRRAQKPKRKARAAQPAVSAQQADAEHPVESETQVGAEQEVEAERQAEPEPQAEPQPVAASRARRADAGTGTDTDTDEDDIDWDAFFAETGHRAVGESRDR
jgi:outer membrane biosynthesis protein TonB